MAANVLVDAGFLVALLAARDRNHGWAVDAAATRAPPWHTCEAVLSEAVFLLGRRCDALAALLGRGAVLVPFQLSEEQGAVLALIGKYADVPMSLADACLVRMSELLPDPVLLTTDRDFRVYRRHGRKVVPCVMPA
jgi:predicted nucleic acid-binding protein